jgi:microsomal dipeptidase-like Zn-dependent dipeptidase
MGPRVTSVVRRAAASLAAALLLIVLLATGFGPELVGKRINPVLGGASTSVSAEAAALHATLIVADLHSDALLWSRDLRERGSWGHLDLPRLREGRVSVQAFTAVTKSPRGMNIQANRGDSDDITLLALLQRWPIRTWTSLTERALFQADKLREVEASERGRFTILDSREDLADYLRRREADPTLLAAFLGIEGAHALEGDLVNVDRLYEAGFRLFGLTHFFDNEVGGSAHGMEKGGLTPFGRELLARIEQRGILVDLAHASPALIDDVLALATRPVVVSHTGVKGTCDNQRNLDDQRLTAVAATGGVVGIGLWEEAVCGVDPAAWARAVRHAVDVAGVDHVGLGSDWDGAVGAIVDAAEAAHLTGALLDIGFPAEEVRKVMGVNVLRVLAEVLPPAGGTLP